MRRLLWLALLPGCAAAQTLTERLQACYRIDEGPARAACVDRVMDPATPEPVPAPATHAATPPPPTWTHRIRVDAMTDEYSCTVTLPGVAGDGAPMLTYRSIHPPFLFLLGDHYPGREIVLRVDDLPAIQSDDSETMTGASLDRLLRQVRTGGTLRTRFIEWPSGAPVDRSFSLAGFADVADRCRDAVARVKRGEPSPL